MVIFIILSLVVVAVLAELALIICVLTHIKNLFVSYSCASLTIGQFMDMWKAYEALNNKESA